MTPGNLPLTLYKGATFGPLQITCKDKDRNAVDLTGWHPFAQVRKKPGDPKVIDLAPVLSDAQNGQITIYFTDEQTAQMPHGDYVWDFLLERPTGEVLGPFLSGTFKIVPIVTRV